MPHTAPDPGEVIVPTRASLCVVGDPIAHSLSPAIHGAAYRALGIDWSYTAERVPAGGLAAFVDAHTPQLRGVSVTMPLKREAFALATDASDLAAHMGIANTLVARLASHTGEFRAENTDVHGIVGAVAGLSAPASIAIVGSGATALSAVFAASELGCAEVRIRARNAGAAHELASRARELGLAASAAQLDDPVTTDAVIQTLPGVAAGLGELHPRTPGAWMLAVAYGSGVESPLTERWRAEGGIVVAGREMLLHQALLQVRLFVTGSIDDALDDEDRVFAAMRGAA